jgi:hypothetical protein
MQKINQLVISIKEKSMKKLLITVSILLAGASVQACLINLENDLDTPVTIRTQQGKADTIAAHGALTFGNSDEKANFTLSKNNTTYHMQQTSCSPDHLIKLKTSDVGVKDIDHFTVNTTTNNTTSNATNSCGCGHK